MARSTNNRKYTKEQVIYNKPRRTLIASYLTPKGIKLANEGASEEVLKKYRKNHYQIDPTAIPIKTIIHHSNHRRIK